MERDQMMTVAEAAEYIGIATVTLYLRLKKRKTDLVFTQYPTGTIRIRRSDVQAFMDSHRRPEQRGG